MKGVNFTERSRLHKVKILLREGRGETLGVKEGQGRFTTVEEGSVLKADSLQEAAPADRYAAG